MKMEIPKLIVSDPIAFHDDTHTLTHTHGSFEL
jgi:hypothetical protein